MQLSDRIIDYWKNSGFLKNPDSLPDAGIYIGISLRSMYESVPQRVLEELVKDSEERTLWSELRDTLSEGTLYEKL